MNKIFYLKIIGSMIASFFIAYMAMKIVFITSSPKIRPHLDQYLAQKAIAPIVFLTSAVSIIGQSLSNVHLFTLNNSPSTKQPDNQATNPPTSSTSPQALMQTLQSIPLNNQAPGIYTKEDVHTSYLLIKEQEVQWQEYTVSNNGQQVTIRVPKGEQQPQQNYLNF